MDTTTAKSRIASLYQAFSQEQLLLQRKSLRAQIRGQKALLATEKQHQRDRVNANYDGIRGNN
jgi:hypothetical protein